METLEPTDAWIMRYLLGRVPVTDCAHFEDRLATDDELLERVSGIERELVRDYLCGDLTWWDGRRFGQRLQASTDLRNKTDAARALMAALSESAEAGAPVVVRHRTRIRIPPFGPISQLVAVSAIILLFAVTAWLSLDAVRLRRTVLDLRSRATESAATPSPLFSFVLTPGISRGDVGKSQRLLVRGQNGKVPLGLVYASPERYTVYRAAVRVVDGGQEVWSGDLSGPERTGGLIYAEIPVAVLDSNDYVLSLRGLTSSGKWEEIETYSFGVIRQEG